MCKVELQQHHDGNRGYEGAGQKYRRGKQKTHKRAQGDQIQKLSTRLGKEYAYQ